jgi:hypothetical protein
MMNNPITATLIMIGSAAAIVATFFVANWFDNRRSRTAPTETARDRYPVPADRTTRHLAQLEKANGVLHAHIVELIAELDAKQAVIDAQAAELEIGRWSRTIDVTETDLLPVTRRTSGSIGWDDWLSDWLQPA